MPVVLPSFLTRLSSAVAVNASSGPRQSGASAFMQSSRWPPLRLAESARSTCVTNARIAQLAPHDRHLLRAADERWRSAHELAERVDFPDPLAAAALARLRSAGL